MMKIFLETFGCTVNKADSMIIKAQLKSYDFAESSEQADVVIINSCAVKLTTENRMISLAKKYKQLGKKVILTGCLPRINEKRSKELGISLVDSNSLNKIKQAVEFEKQVHFFSDVHENKIKLEHFQDSSITAVVELSEGCLGTCSFCGTKNARGNLTSYPSEDIYNYVKKLIESGKKEILMTSQDTGCYGADSGENLFDLIQKITEIPEDFRIRIGMANPHFVFNEKEKWAEMLSKEKVFSFIHIPIQSGSNEVLKKMNRVGTAEQFEELANYLRKNVENISIMMDIIAGFPEETEGDFEKTMELIEKARPDITNISMFYPRPETKAALMKKVPTDISKQRTRKLTELVKKISLEQNKKMINREIECLVTGKLDDGKTHSRSFNYKQVIFPEKKNGLVCVKITKATPDYLLGTLLNS